MPLPSIEKLRESTKGAVELARDRSKDAIEMARQGSKKGVELASQKIKLMRNPDTNEAELTVGGGGNDEEEASVSAASSASSRMEEFADSYCPKLTWQQRLIGFSVSFGIGYLITFLSFKFFIELVEGRPVPFALNYSFGNLLSLSSMTFLCGPTKQFKNMFDDKRKFTSITYLSCLFATLICVFIPFPGFIRLVLLVFLVLAQFCACVWYSLSYIPFGRRWALKCIKRQLGIEENSEIVSLGGQS